MHKKHIMYEGQPSTVIYIKGSVSCFIIGNRAHLDDTFYVMPKHEYEAVAKTAKDLPPKINLIDWYSHKFHKIYKISKEKAKRLFREPHLPGTSGFVDEEWANKNYNPPI